MVESTGLESHKRVEQAKKNDEKIAEEAGKEEQLGGTLNNILTCFRVPRRQK